MLTRLNLTSATQPSLKMLIHCQELKKDASAMKKMVKSVIILNRESRSTGDRREEKGSSEKNRSKLQQLLSKLQKKLLQREQLK